MYLHATGTIPDLDKLEPYRPEETRVLAELHAEGVVKSLFRLSDRPGVYLIVEADDVEEARALVARHERKLPGSRVQAGQDGAVQRVAPAAVRAPGPGRPATAAGECRLGAALRSRRGQPPAWPSSIPPRDSRARHGQALRWGSVPGIPGRRENLSDLSVSLMLAS